MADLFARAGYMDRQIDALSAVMKRDSADWESALNLADIYMRLGWFHEADPLLEAARTLAPNSPKPLLATGTSEYLRGKFREMRTWIERGLKLAPNDTTLHASHAEALRLLQDLPGAERELRTAISLTHDSRLLGRDYRDLSHLYLESGWPHPRTAESEAAAHAALRLDSGDWQTEYWLARALQLDGKDREATALFEDVARHDSTFETVSYQLGMIYRRSPDKSKQADGTRLLQFYSTIRDRQRKYDDDLATLTSHPSLVKAHAVMVTWYISQDRYPEAIVELRRILQMTPRDSVARKLLVRVLRAAKRDTEANDVAAGRSLP